MKQSSEVGSLPGDKHREVGSLPGGKHREVGSLPGGKHCEVGSLPGGKHREVGSLPGGKHREVGSLPGGKHREVGSLPGGKHCEVGSLPGGKHCEVGSLPGGKHREVGSLPGELHTFPIHLPDLPPRSSYQPDVPPDAIRDIIKAAMVAKGVREQDIPTEHYFASPEDGANSKRYIEVKGFAWFVCLRKDCRWPSAQSWCFMDLKTQSICYRDKQECKKCESEASPEFTREALERMAEYAVKSFQIRTGRERREYHPRSTDTEDTQGGPHDEGRCGKCQRLGHSCWNRTAFKLYMSL